jgi:hypothetical protein
MNSNSRYYHDDECDPCGKEKSMPYKKEKKETCPTIIKCSNPGAVTIPLATVVGTTFTPTSLTLNTGGLCNPCTKLEFTSNVVATAFTGSISFQIFKQCVNQLTPVPVGPAFTYSRIVAVTDSDTFTFFICDCDSCFNDCCTYTVVITVNAVTVGVLAINNATLGAITTCQTSGCCF